MSVILPVVLPVFLTALIGYLYARTGRALDNSTVSFLVAGVGTPALVFYNLAKTTVPPDAMLRIGAATLIAISLYVIVGACVLKLAGLRLRTYLPALSFPNSGNLGLPLALYAAGEEGLKFAIVVFALTSVCNLTIGQGIAAGRGKLSTVLKSPIVPATIAGMIFAWAHIPLPLWAHNTLDLLSGITIPLMLIMLGTSLAKIRMTTIGRSVALGSLRIGMGIAAGFAISALFGFTGAERVAFVLQCSMPVAVYNYFFAKMHDNDPEEVASLVVASTLISVITVSALLAVLVR